jgi:hypothetical protein
MRRRRVVHAVQGKPRVPRQSKRVDGESRQLLDGLLVARARPRGRRRELGEAFRDEED